MSSEMLSNIEIRNFKELNEKYSKIYYGKVLTDFESDALIGVIIDDKNPVFCFWHFTNNQEHKYKQYLKDLQQLWINKTFEENVELMNGIFDQYIKVADFQQKVSLVLNGSEFQQEVWKSLLKIPYGEVRTYQEMARDYLGKPNAVRAVANAVARNNLAVLVPCHRVVPKTIASRGKYRWGSNIKELILNTEQKKKNLSMV